MAQQADEMVCTFEMNPLPIALVIVYRTDI
jgi:hypothetical protein